MEIKLAHVGDSKNFLKFAPEHGGKILGTIYVPKEDYPDSQVEVTVIVKPTKDDTTV